MLCSENDGASLVAQVVKNPPAVRESWVRSLGWEDPLEKGKATHSSILAWRIPKDRGAWRATVHGVAESDTTEQISTNNENDEDSFSYKPLILVLSKVSLTAVYI